MNKSELINAIAEKAGLSKADAKKALEACTGAIEEALVAGDKVALVGFGTFEAKKREAREGRNPLTGATVQIPAKVVPSFKAGSKLKDALN